MNIYHIIGYAILFLFFSALFILMCKMLSAIEAVFIFAIALTLAGVVIMAGFLIAK